MGNKRRKIRATSADGGRCRAAELETKRRTNGKRRKEAQIEQLEQEVAKIGIEKTTKSMKERQPAFSRSEISDGTSVLFRKDARMEQLEHREAETEQLAADGKRRDVFGSSTWETEVLIDLSNVHICTKTNTFDLTAFLLFRKEAVLEQDMAKAEMVGNTMYDVPAF